MSVKILTEVLDHAPSKGGELVYLIALADQANDDDRCAWPGVKTLTRRSRAGRSTVYEYATAAQEKGIIERCPEDALPFRFRRNPGREAVVWRFKPLQEWGVDLTSDGGNGSVAEGVRNLDGSSPPDPRGPARRTRTTTTTTTKENNSTATQQSRSLRRAARGRQQDDSEWNDPATAPFSKSAEPAADDDAVGDPLPTKRPGQDTVVGLTLYYRSQVSIHGFGQAGNFHGKAVGRAIGAAKRAGVPPETIRQMVDVFVADEQLFNRGDTRWRTFVANLPLLQRRAENLRAASSPREFAVSGTIPQAMLDEILAEAG